MIVLSKSILKRFQWLRLALHASNEKAAIFLSFKWDRKRLAGQGTVTPCRKPKILTDRDRKEE
jgi:hypothetical protein